MLILFFYISFGMMTIIFNWRSREKLWIEMGKLGLSALVCILWILLNIVPVFKEIIAAACSIFCLMLLINWAQNKVFSSNKEISK